MKYLRLSAVLLSCLLGGTAIADDAARSKALVAVYDHYGVHAHLSWVHKTVVEESQQAWQACSDHKLQPEIESMLEENLSIEALRTDFLTELDERIEPQQLDQIIAWTTSDAGKNIFQAELASLDFDESDFESLLAKYTQSEVHGEQRNTRLKHMLADTGAVYFLSALNTELSALVTMASVCSNSEDALAAAQKQVREDRGAEALYRSFMRQELIAPSAVVYREISDDDLDALSEFANSDAGNAYYSALIKGTRNLLENKVDRLSNKLEAMPGRVD